MKIGGTAKILHLDCKGMIPAAKAMPDYLRFFRDCGFDTVCWELDCHYDWNCWPGATRPVWSRADWRGILRTARELGLRSFPLVQSIGHLEWVLTCRRYARWRENGAVDELCPRRDGALELIVRWIDEALELFERPEYIHLGADESWNLGSCPRCRAAKNRFDGYLNHVNALCRHALNRGARPLIWADMFARQTARLRELPDEVIPVLWEYRGDPAPQVAKFRATGREFFGAAALQCYDADDALRLTPDLAARRANIAAWENAGVSVIHTTWSRPNNLLPLYAPWCALFPLFRAAGGRHDAALSPALAKLETDFTALDAACRDLAAAARILESGRRARAACAAVVGENKDYAAVAFRPEEKAHVRAVAAFKKDLIHRLRSAALCDAEEFAAEKVSPLNIGEEK